MELTQELVKSLFDYRNGFLYWKNRPKFSPELTGNPAGYLNKRSTGDRRMVTIDYKDYQASRIIFLWHNGYLPKEVDHEDRNTLNDKIENLRAATRTENSANRVFKPSDRKTSIYKGVRLHKAKYWHAQIKFGNRTKHIGTFKTEGLAALAYNREAVRCFGEFAYLNIIMPQTVVVAALGFVVEPWTVGVFEPAVA